METRIINASLTEIYSGGGKWLTQNFPTCYREWHKRVLLVGGQGADLWREADDAEKAAWERNPPVPAKRDDFTPVIKNWHFVQNETTGYYEKNGIRDLTEDDVLEIIKAGSVRPAHNLGWYSNLPIRTNEAEAHISIEVYRYTFHNCRNLEVAKVSMMYKGEGTFNGCDKLHTVLDIWPEAGGNWSTNTFKGCKSLRELRLRWGRNETNKVWFTDSPLLSVDSVEWLAGSKCPGTAYFHPDVYAKLTGDTTNAACAALTEEERKRWAGVMELAVANSQVFTTG